MSDTETPERASILAVAKDLIHARGAEGWTLAELAERAGVGADVVGAEFESEWDVFSAVIRRDERRFEAVFEDPNGLSAGERMVALFEAIVPDFDWSLWIELWSLALRDERASALRIALDQRFRKLIESIIWDGVESGEFEVADSARDALTIATLIDAMATHATLGDTTVLPNYMLDALATVAGELLGTQLPLRRLEDRDE